MIVIESLNNTSAQLVEADSGVVEGIERGAGEQRLLADVLQQIRATEQ